MKFLCPNCSAKYRIGPEKLLGRQAAKIRCRKCGYRIHITRKGAEDWDVTAIPIDVQRAAGVAAAPAGVAAAPAGVAAVPAGVAAAPAASRLQRAPTEAVPGLPGIQARAGVREAAEAPKGLPPAGAVEAPAAAEARPSPPRVSRPKGPPRAAGRRSPKGALREGDTRPERGDTAKPVAGSRSGAPVLREMVKQELESAGPPQLDVPEEDWFVGVNGVPLGPIPLGELKQLVSAGHVDGRSLVWRDGWPQWKALRKVEGLSKLLEGSEPTDGSPLAPPDLRSAPSLPEISTSAPPLPSEAVEGGSPAGAAAPADPTAPTAWDDVVGGGEEEADEMATMVQDRPFGLPIDGELSEPGLGAVVSAATVPSVRVEAPASSEEQYPGRSRAAHLALAVLAVLAVGAVILVMLSRARQGDSVAPLESTAVQAEGDAPIRVVRAEELPTSPVEGAAAAEEPAPPESAAKPPPSKRTRRRRKGRSSGGSEGKSKEAVPKTTKPIRAKKDLLAGLGALGTPGPPTTSGSTKSGSTAGQLDAVSINRVVRGHQSSLRRACWKEASATREPGAPPAARFQIEVEIDRSGKVTAARRKEEARGYPGLAECVARKVRVWRFPRSSDSTTVTIPFVFVGQ